MLLHIATGENTNVEHAVTVITAVRDGDVVVIDHTVMCRIKPNPTLVMVHLHPSVRGTLSTQQSGDITRGETNMAAHPITESGLNANGSRYSSDKRR